MQKKYIIIAAAIIIIAIIGAAAILLGAGGDSVGVDPSTMGKTVLKVSSNDKDLSGQITLWEFDDVEENENGTYNLSQFGDYFGLLGWNGGNGRTQTINIVNGEATYEIPDNVKVFMLDTYITDLNKDFGYDSAGDNVTITVELFVNGVLKFSSSDHPYSDQANLDFGHQLIFHDGSVLKESLLIPDTPHNSFTNDN